MFSKLPASRSLEEDLPLSQGVTASRDLPNLYLRCNLYLSCSVYSCRIKPAKLQDPAPPPRRRAPRHFFPWCSRLPGAFLRSAGGK